MLDRQCTLHKLSEKKYGHDSMPQNGSDIFYRIMQITYPCLYTQGHRHISYAKVWISKYWDLSITYHGYIIIVQMDLSLTVVEGDDTGMNQICCV